MKKYIKSLSMVLFAMLAFTACSEDEGTNPGNDATPSVIVYAYDVAKPYNADNDVSLRFAANNKTTEAYYLVEKKADHDAHLASMGEEGYKDYVVSNGKKIDGISGESNADLVVTDLYGPYAISAVGVAGNTKSLFTVNFTGLEWEDVVSGTYYFQTQVVSGRNLGIAPAATTLQVCTTDKTLYRFKDLFGEGYSMKINLIDYTGKDDGGDYQFFRVPVMETPLTYGSYGAISVKDIGYWQGNSAFVTDNGYESGMYEDHSCFVFVAYTISAGTLAYGYDAFEPNN